MLVNLKMEDIEWLYDELQYQASEVRGDKECFGYVEQCDKICKELKRQLKLKNK